MYGGTSSLDWLSSHKRSSSSGHHHSHKRSLALIRQQYRPPSDRMPLLLHRVYWYARQLQHYIFFRPVDIEYDDLDVPAPHYRPKSLGSICSLTKFSRREVQVMYRSFKQGCPDGYVGLAQFKEIYTQFFPQGGGSRYSEYVFRTFDRDDNGMISFEEFVVGLSILSRGTIDEKLAWIFDLYDIRRRGFISRDELIAVVRSMYDLIGKNANPPITDAIVGDHANVVFRKMDENDDGLITRTEFLANCRKDEELCNSLILFDTKCYRLLSKTIMDKSEMQRTVDSLKYQLNITRISISQSASELKRFVETQQESDPLVVPIDKRFNPWAEKSKCTII